MVINEAGYIWEIKFRIATTRHPSTTRSWFSSGKWT
jgi:hypothetical protein